MDETIARAVVIIRYVRMIHRLFLALDRAGMAVEFAELILCGRVADALHNAPSLMLRYDAKRAFEIELAISRLRSAVPSALRPIAFRMIEDGGPSAGIQRDHDFAPKEHFDRFLKVLKYVLIGARNRWCGAWSVTDRSPAFGPKSSSSLDLPGTAASDPADVEDAIWWGRIASTVSDVPLALIHWKAYDQERLRDKVSGLVAGMPDRIHGNCSIWLPLLVGSKEP